MLSPKKYLYTFSIYLFNTLNASLFNKISEQETIKGITILYMMFGCVCLQLYEYMYVLYRGERLFCEHVQALTRFVRVLWLNEIPQNLCSILQDPSSTAIHQFYVCICLFVCLSFHILYTLQRQKILYSTTPASMIVCLYISHLKTKQKQMNLNERLIDYRTTIPMSFLWKAIEIGITNILFLGARYKRLHKRCSV